MRKLNKSALLLPVIAFLAWLALPAGRSDAQEIETREITVTSTRTERDLFEIPMTVGVKTDEDLKWQPATNVADFLADIPGIQVTDGSMAGGKRIVIRGESPTRSLILIDGVKISEQKSMSGSAILVDTSQIERIELIKGPASVLYGSEAIGGVINIITKKGGDKPVAFSQNFILDSSTNSLEWQTALFGSHKGFNYRVSGSGINAQDRLTPGGKVGNSDYNNQYFTGRLGYEWDNGSIYVKADDYRSVIHIPTYEEWILAYRGVAVLTKSTVELDLPKWDRYSVSGGAELRNLWPALEKVKLDLYYQNMKKDFENTVRVDFFSTLPILAGRFMNVKIHTVNDQDSFGGNLQSDWKLGDHYLIAGLAYNKDILTADERRPSVLTNPPGPPSPPALTAASAFRYKAEQTTIGAYAQDEWVLPANLTATLGVRNTWVRSGLKANNNPALQDRPDKSASKLVGNVGLAWFGLGWKILPLGHPGHRATSSRP
jgi:hemoglobin/transferrin/lactoferrin receptor protein